MANTICHVEWDVTDLQSAQAFYSTLFNWTFRQFGPDMIVFGEGDKHLGGLIKVDSVQPGRSPSVWIEVENLEAHLEKAERAGGKVVRDKAEVPNVGWSAQIGDPDGNHVGLVQFAK